MRTATDDHLESKPAPRPKPRRKLLIVRLTLILIGALVFGAALFVRHVAQASLDWPTADGVITAARTVSTSGGPRGAPRTEARIEYSYTVNGGVYRNDVLSFGGNSTRFGDKPQDIVAGYREGLAVRVSYDPTNPRQSVLEPGAEASSTLLWLMISFGGACILVGVFPGLLGIRSKAPDRD